MKAKKGCCQMFGLPPFGGKTIAQLVQWCWVSSGVSVCYLGAKVSDVELPSVTKPLHNLCNGVGCQVSSYVGNHCTIRAMMLGVK